MSKKISIINRVNGKLMCPECNSNDLKICDYGLSDDKEKGLFLFILQCNKCKKKYKHYSSLED